MDGLIWSLAILAIVSVIFGLGAVAHYVVEWHLNRKEQRRASALRSRAGISQRVVVLQRANRFRERAVRSAAK